VGREQRALLRRRGPRPPPVDSRAGAEGRRLRHPIQGYGVLTATTSPRSAPSRRRP